VKLAGIHHVTAVTANPGANLAFYTRTLGLRLVKKTVNQDDVSAFHLFYADGTGSPGTDMTFFDWPVPPERRGTGSIVRTGFRLGDEASLEWWARRLTDAGVAHSGVRALDGRASLDFEDGEGQRLGFVVEGGAREPARPWARSPVPPEYQPRGLGPVRLSVRKLEPTDQVLTSVMNLRRVREFNDEDSAVVQVYEMGEGGAGAELQVVVEPGRQPARQGAGGVHHVAFRTTAADFAAWADRLEALGVSSSGPVDRYYFRSLYFREPNGILFEIATDEPGFAVDEPEGELGERLALPPFLEARRKEIEAGLDQAILNPPAGS